jgi:hypothetical protein
MATRLKTVEFNMPVLDSAVNNTLTSLTQITVYLPETGTKTFRSVYAKVSAMQTATAAGNITSRNLQCRLGAAAFAANSNANLYTGSGEDIFLEHTVSLTTHFNTNWTGTSMTFDAQVQLNGTATTAAWTNICVVLYVTYEYDDTSTTQIKTVRIPLDAPVGALGITKPGTALATIPNLSTELPEASKVFRNSFITVQGNIAQATATGDITLTLQLDATAAHTSGIFEGVSSSDYFMRYTWDCSAVLNTAASMGYYLYASVAKFNHVQAWLTITYEFDASAANDVFVSLMVPTEILGTFGPGTSTAKESKLSLFIQEPGTITTKQLAYFIFWEQAAATATVGFKLGIGSFVAYTDTAATLCGSNAAMVRNDTAYTLARGENVLSCSAYTTDVADFGFSVSGFWIINYTAGKPTQGHGAVNHTVLYQTRSYLSTSAALAILQYSANLVIPETDYFINNISHRLNYLTNTTSQFAGIILDIQTSTSIWKTVCERTTYTDPETGIRILYTQLDEHIFKYPTQPITEEYQVLATAIGNMRFITGNAIPIFVEAEFIYTYHTITYTVSGTITNSAGGTVNLLLNDSTGKSLATTTRTGNGTFYFTWYDNVTPVFVSAYEDSTHLGRSALAVAA